MNLLSRTVWIASAIAACGCSTVGRSSKSAFVEGQLVGTWRDGFGRSFTYKPDGAWSSSNGFVASYRVEYPFLRFTYASGQSVSYTITAYDFAGVRPSFTVQDQMGNLQTLTKTYH